MLKKWMAGISGAVILTFGGMTAVHADHSDTKNCGDFNTGEEVWEFWTEHGYSSENDPDRLDGDNDGLPCENLTGSLSGQFAEYDAEQTGNGDNNNNDNNENNNNDNNYNEENNADENNYNEAENEGNNVNENEANHEDEENENTAANDNNEEGEVMADTSTTYPLMALIGIIAAGAGAFMFVGRKKTAQA